MKRTFIISFVIAISCYGTMAQSLKVANRYEIMPERTETKFYPVFNASGDKLLFSTTGYTGLQLYDFAQNKVNTISNAAGAGYEPIFDASENKIFYRTTSFENNRRFDAIQSYDLNTGVQRQMLPPSREVKQARNFHNGLLVMADKKLMKSTFGSTQKSIPNFVTTDDLRIVLYRNNIRYEMNPLREADSRYIWVSLSPDNSKLLFTAAGRGTFVSDLDGKIIASLGYLNAPVWYNNQYVVGMNDKDDGHVVTSSEIKIVNIDNKKATIISTNNQIAMYPAAAGNANRIAYHTTDGKIFVVEME